MYVLTHQYIEKYYNQFMCSYGQTNNSNIISHNNYIPETFFVNEKRQNKQIIFFQEITYKEWVTDIIQDVCRNLFDTNNNKILLERIYNNIETLLDYKHSDQHITNQEFVDVIRKVVVFTIYGDVKKDIDMSYNFNQLAMEIMPIVVDKIRKKRLNTKELLIYSILSGLSGLDLKGAPSASSNYSNEGIAMAEYFQINPNVSSIKFLNSLDNVRKKCEIGILHYNKFLSFISQKKELVWMTDDFIESYFDLLFIERILDDYQINVTIIPKNGHYGNDMCYEDLNKIINSNVFHSLYKYINNGRLYISHDGPKMGAANINKFSHENIQCIEKADVIFMKGCRIHEMLQGSINKDTFSAFNVVRKISEITSGFSSSRKTVLMFHLSPKEYSFFGTKYEDVHTMYSGQTCNSVSTISDHFFRKESASIEQNVNEFVKLKQIMKSYSGNIIPLQKELNMLANKFEEYTSKEYTLNSAAYQKLKRPNMEKINSLLWERLFEKITNCLHKKLNDVSLLDIGTGDGRDIEYCIKYGINAYGIDNSKGFIEILENKAKSGILPSKCFTYANMCNLPMRDSIYDVVRMNASLLHLPIIGKGYTADLALSEAWRVLRSNGLLVILVKEGQGISLVDTNEQLGKRIYQLYTNDLLNEILLRNGFITIDSSNYCEERSGNKIHWIANIAQKVESSIEI